MATIVSTTERSGCSKDESEQEKEKDVTSAKWRLCVARENKNAHLVLSCKQQSGANTLSPRLHIISGPRRSVVCRKRLRPALSANFLASKCSAAEEKEKKKRRERETAPFVKVGANSPMTTALLVRIV